MAPRRRTTGSSDDQDMDNEDYRKKRERNNRAVKLCREKTSKKVNETKVRVDTLKQENIRLEEKIKGLKNTVKYLKDLLLEADSSEERRKAIKKIIEEGEEEDNSLNI